ncbi:hypothetical protein GOBAR_DD07373 [Gossypium barbadense]|nr:hypothetical protein GOBAR_DD07373 [Gossypium barbadense]
MNRCSFQENASVSSCDHQRGGLVVCPKPRRIGVLANNPNRSLRLHLSHQAEVSDLRAGAELLDIILKKEDFGIEQSATQVASSPPFFCGSPPSRVSNPLVQDAQFRGCVRMKFGLKPATVRENLSATISENKASEGGCHYLNATSDAFGIKINLSFIFDDD